MTRSRAEVERAIDTAARHVWDRHAGQGMYVKLGIESVTELREHLEATVWEASTECFIASFDREIFYDQHTNTRVILFYRGAGTCLVTRAGAREFRKQYDDEVDRHRRSGNPNSMMPVIVSGGLSALHPDVGPRLTGETTSRHDRGDLD